jgi:hypothetical protein
MIVSGPKIDAGPAPILKEVPAMVNGGLPLFLVDFLWLFFIFLIFLGRFKGVFGFQSVFDSDAQED